MAMENRQKGRNSDHTNLTWIAHAFSETKKYKNCDLHKELDWDVTNQFPLNKRLKPPVKWP